jgi:hypothetical protein
MDEGNEAEGNEAEGNEAEGNEAEGNDAEEDYKLRLIHVHEGHICMPMLLVRWKSWRGSSLGPMT